jgi:arginase
MRTVHIIGVPLDLGGSRRGVDMGPSAFRIAGISEHLGKLGYRVVDRGNLSAPTQETEEPRDERQKYVHVIATVCRSVYEAALQAFESGATPLVLGGDHSLAAGSIAAAAQWGRTSARLPIGLIWVDAHGDMNTPATSTTGNVHGMPLAAVLGPEPAELSQIGGWSPKVFPAHTVLVGVRNLDEREKAAVRESHAHVFTIKDVDRLGVSAVVEQAVALASTGTVGIHVSFDLDACDPSIAPGVGTPVRGGLNYREAHTLMEIVAESNTLMSLDMVEVNPTLDVRNATAELGTELVMSALGLKIL